jgi:hypothetical protein
VADSLDTRALEIGGIIDEFWSALKQRMPEAFERPNDYALFKSNGVGPNGEDRVVTYGPAGKLQEIIEVFENAKKASSKAEILKKISPQGLGQSSSTKSPGLSVATFSAISGPLARMVGQSLVGKTRIASFLPTTCC